jgi:NTE family protein
MDIAVTNTESTEPYYHNLVLSSGGFKGIAQLGAIKRLAESGLINLKKLKGVAGCSAGAMLGMMIIAGMSPDEIWRLFYGINVSEYLEMDPLLILERGGASTGKKIYNLLEEILRERTGIKHITFDQFYRKTGVHFIVVGSSVKTKTAVYYDHLNTPNLKVSLAVRISIGVPIVFTPIEIDGEYQIDGAVCDSYPIELFKNDIEKTIGIRCNETFNTEFNNVPQYLFALAMLSLHQHFSKTCELYPDHTIIINDKKSTSVVAGQIADETKEELYQTGIQAADEFINHLKNHS